MKKNLKIGLVYIMLFMIIGLLSACQQQSADLNQNENQAGQLSGYIAVSGAWALYPMMIRWTEEFNSIHPAVRFDISAGGAGKGIADAIAGAVDIGMVSREVSPEEEAKGAYWISVTKDAVFPIVNEQNPAYNILMQQGITRQDFIDLYINGEILTWGELVGDPTNADNIHIYTRSDACGAAETWAKFLGSKQEDLLGIGIFSDPGLVEAIIQDPYGLAYGNMSYVFDFKNKRPLSGIALLPIDINNNNQVDYEEILDSKDKAVEMVATGIYPSPPARDLNLVTNGKPSGLVAEFIRWILTEGQEYVDEAGYVKLTPDILASELGKLK